MMSCMRLPRYICPAWYCSVISFFIIFLFLSVGFAEDNSSINLDSAEKIHITADSLVSDSNAKFAEFIGNVEAIQGEFFINSDRLKIFYKGDAKEKTASGTGESIEKIIATGNVHIKSKDMSAVTQQAQYNTDTMIITLTGEGSKVFDQKNFVTGSKIILYRKEGVTKVEGDKTKRVTAVFYPKEKTAAAKEGEKEKGLKAEKPENISGATKEITPEKQVLLPENTGSTEKETLASNEALTKPMVQPEAIALIPVPPAPPVISHITPKNDNTKPDQAAEKFTHGRFKTSMGVTIFEDKTVNGATGFQETLSKNLTENIKKNCPDILLLKTGANNYPSSFINYPRLASGNIDTYKLCETGRLLGLNTILTGSITDIKTDSKSSGRLFWKKTVPEISMTVRIELFDTETATKLFDKSYTYKADSDKAGPELAKSGKFEPAFLKAALTYYTSSAGSLLCNILKEKKWKGFISSVSEDKVNISSGRNMGFVSGMVFEVFGNKVVNGVENQKFLVPGAKAGEIKITNVLDNSSEAVKISGSALKEGYVLKPK
ncbi:MAG: lipopolysaccharide transport periplasmic protein LptA [Desulfobacterium sp.]|nr:lipopolysaccharide transport periplasmic protein LptA [Desulfobacterium sp.]MBU4036787.1 lipopolysaccharide transport periplasmic protein LptA [Pseudomonadota bacterium]